MSRHTAARLTTTFADQQAFASRLALVNEEAQRLGLHATGHAIHEAVKVVGFEIAEIMEQKDKISRKREKGRNRA